MSLSSGYLHRNDRPATYPASYYAATANAVVERPAFEGDARADVCIVGAGYTGLSAALHLAERGYSVVVLEAHRAGWGASGRNGGQLGSGQRVEQMALEAMVGLDTARELWEVAEAAKTLATSLISKHTIDCDLKPGFLHADHRARFARDTREYVDDLRTKYNYDQVRYVEPDELSEMLGGHGYHGGYTDDGAYHLHPLNFAFGLARAAESAGAQIFERSQVLSIDPASTAAGARPRVTLAAGSVEADHLILACNGYLESLSETVASRVMPINNFIVATEPLDESMARSLIRDDVAVSDSRFVINYYRLSADRRMLFGGGENYGARFPADIKSFVRKPMLNVFPQLKDVRIDYGWGGTLGITYKRLPCLMRLGPTTLSASGYSGHGVALATLSGQILADAVDGVAGRFDLLSSLPTPRFPGGTQMRWPLLVMGMLYYALRDRL